MQGQTTNSSPVSSNKRWFLLALVSSLFFMTTGGAFSSLGVLLPEMINEIGWSWTQAGLGFTVLALFTGLASTLPSFTINKMGIRLTYLLGGIMVAVGFFILSITNNLTVYLIGTGFVGLGYAQSGAVPAIAVLSGWFSKRRSFAIGLFFTTGALGSVVGPLAASFSLSIFPSWRDYWLIIAVITAILTLITVSFVTEHPTTTEKPEEQDKANAELDVQSWTFQEVLRNPQYYVIMIGVTITLLGALTMNTWQATHMQNLGVAATVTAGALSSHALFNAMSRLMGGIIIDRIGAKVLFASGLAAGVVGMVALAYADSPILILIFAMADGFSFGIVTFASAILLIQYYGVKNNPIILGFVNLITTLAMIGPALAGYIADKTGGFAITFIAIAGLMGVVFIMALKMTKPVRRMRTNASAPADT